MVRCRSNRKERDIYPHYDEGGDAGRAERIRSRVWSHMCDVDQKKWYNQQLQSGSVNLDNQFNIRMWKAHHDANLSFNLSRIQHAEERKPIDHYAGWTPHADFSDCNCSWRSSTSLGVEPAREHPVNSRQPRPTRDAETKREIKSFRRHGLQATAITAEGPVTFAWPDTIRPMTLATFGRDGDADHCLYKNPVSLAPISMSKRVKTFIR